MFIYFDCGILVFWSAIIRVGSYKTHEDFDDMWVLSIPSFTWIKASMH